MAYKEFANGFPLYASEINSYLMNQSVMVFADSTARTAAIPTPTEGMITYLEDTDTVEVYNGTAWTDINDNTAAIPKSTVTAAGDLIVADGASSVTNLAIGSSGQALISNGSTATWADIPPITNEGDLVIGNSSGVATRLPIGANNRVLTSNGTTASWETISAGGLTVIASGSISGSGSITSIPGTYKHLALACDSIGTNITSSRIYLRVNNDTSTAYNYNGVSAGSPIQNDSSYFPLTYESADPTNKQGSSWTTIHNYADTTAYQKLITNSVSHRPSGSSWLKSALINGGYLGSGAITSIQITSALANANLNYVLYGVN